MPAQELFIDTAGWVCHLDTDQPYHAAATTIIGVCLAEGRRLITTNYIMIELVALLTTRRRIKRPQIIEAVQNIADSPQTVMLHIDPELHSAAWQLLRERPDKEWSLVDCTSFTIMARRNLREALTTDHHFEQAGLVRLLKP